MTEQGRPGRDEDRLTAPTATGTTTDKTTTTEGTDAVRTESPTTGTTTSADPEPVRPGTAFPAYPAGSTAGVLDPAPADPAQARRRGPDPLALLVGLVTLAMAVFAFVGELPDLPDPRWLLAGGAALVGLVLLVGSLRGRRGPHGG